ncbi:AAA family ATPase [Aurantimonas aggregata]|uniref:AAA family ATPase n=1 Tax=Aurantimonas aggregata TaxID=2047720 RepID=A0A6L9MM34_9HYPH|nr:adenylate/guanylate cyclase domain-containing protein [Aurantimonas aggregata]NDV88762.1 AAA family ATPase [Aurantimonas aggregata]
MRCPSCSTENPAGRTHCEDCGEPVVVSCPGCAAESPAAAAFCSACGTRLSDRPPATALKLTASGEFKQATILFADIVSSTRLLARLDPEQAMDRLRPAIAAMCDAVTRFDGTVVQTMGDGIFALFGAPRAQEGHAFLACEAALALQQAFAQREDGLKIRVGLHTGEVVFGPPGADPQGRRDAHGVAIHLASRLQALADAGGICISEQSYRLIRSSFVTGSLGARRLEGIPEPVSVFQLLARRRGPASREFRGATLTAFCGRTTEIGALRDTLCAIESGETRVTGIEGAPGSGKSRLCYEFAEWCRGRGLPVYEARAQPYGHATPLQLALDFLRMILQVSSSDDPEVTRDRIAERLTEIGATFEADRALLFEFLGLADEQQRSLASPKARQTRLLDILRDLVRQIGRQPSVIIVEDLHWADAASGEFLAALVEAVESTRTMLVFNYRPAYRAPFMRTPHYRSMFLAELSNTETDAILDTLVGTRPELKDIHRRVAERSGGNVFFMEELVRSLSENGTLLGAPGSYTLGSPANDNALPSTVQDVIGARIDRLDPVERAVLQIGAMIGKQFPLNVLESVAEVPQADVQTALDRLSAAEMIEPQQGAGGRCYAFRHPLIQEVAYRTQLKSRRAVLHAAVAEAMQSYSEGRLDEDAALIAYHHEAAGHTLAAATFGARAARWVGATSTGEAIKRWRKVRTMLLGEIRCPEVDQLRIMASAQIAWLGWREGVTVEEARPYLAEALQIARETDDAMVALLLFVEARLAGASGGPADDYAAQIEQALALVEPTGDRGRAATLNASLSQAYGWAGLFTKALAANDAALERIPAIEPFDHQFLGYSVEHWVLSLRGRILVHLGRPDEARACFDQMLALEPALVDPTVLFISHLGMIELAWFQQDASLAAEHAASVAALAERHGSPYLLVFRHYCNGLATAIGGDPVAALRDLERALTSIVTMKAARDHAADTLAVIAECHFQAGQEAQALAAADQAIDAARTLTARMPELRAMLVKGAAYLARDGSARLLEAEDLFDEADRLIQQTGAFVFEPMLAQGRAMMDPLRDFPLYGYK